MNQCEIWNADLSPTREGEQAEYRPIVIISGNLLNQHLPVVIACPLTSKIKAYKGNVILNPNKQNGLKLRSEVLTFHIRSISKIRLVERLGEISNQDLKVIKTTLGDILRY